MEVFRLKDEFALHEKERSWESPTFDERKKEKKKVFIAYHNIRGRFFLACILIEMHFSLGLDACPRVFDDIRNLVHLMKNFHYTHAHTHI